MLGKGPPNLTEIATKLDIDKSTVHRLFGTLEDLSYVGRNPDHQKYDLSVKLIEHGRRVASDSELDRVALPSHKRLEEFSEETASLSVLHKHASGKGMLAYMSEPDVERIYQISGFPAMTPNTINTPEVLSEELRRTLEQGYALIDTSKWFQFTQRIYQHFKLMEFRRSE